MEKIRKHFADKENIVVAVFFLITVIVACNPLISRYCIQGHDIDYHLLRIEALKEGILRGHPFAKVNLLFFGGAGYASSMFYSDLILYIPALLRVIGVSIGASYHIFVALCVILCYLTSYGHPLERRDRTVLQLRHQPYVLQDGWQGQGSCSGSS